MMLVNLVLWIWACLATAALLLVINARRYTPGTRCARCRNPIYQFGAVCLRDGRLVCGDCAVELRREICRD
jgi:hypothetical protein